MPSPAAVRAPRAPLPPLARRLLLATAVSALGNGLVLPFLVVYLHQVRGMPTSVAGLVVAFQAVLGFVVAPAAGALIDRIGPRPVMIVSPLIMALGSLAYSMVRTPVQALGAAFLLALGGAALWPAGATMVSRLVGDEQRSRAFGIQFMLLNLGIGIGGLIAGLVVDVSRPRTFELLYVGDAVTFVAYALIMSTFVGVGGALPRDPSGDEPTGGYRDVLRDRAMVRLSIVSLLLLSSGYGALEVGFPVFATQVVGVSPRLVAFGYVGNTVAIVLGQLYALRLVEGRSRSRVIAVVGIIWAGSWLLLGLAVPVDSHVVVVSLVLLSPVVFALGETLWQPVAPSIVNELAPEHLRGRYNAFGSLTWNVAGVVGPATAGLLLGADHPVWWLAVVIGGSLAGSVATIGLRRQLTTVQDGRVPTPVG